jgi:hypothetical protein
MNPTVLQLAKEAAAKYPQPEAATKAALSYLEQNPELRTAVLEELFVSAIRTYIYSARHILRDAAKENRCPRGLETIMSVAQDMTAAILDRWVMRDGRKLGDWTGAELAKEAMLENAEATGHQKNATFYTQLAKIAEGQFVREKIAAKDAWNIWAGIAGIEAKQARPMLLSA